MNELQIAIKHFDLYYFLAIQDVKSRFRRSKLGVFWIVIQQLVYAFGVGLIWSNLFGINYKEFVPFITIGISLWQFISSGVTDGSMTFTIAQGYIKQMPIPQSVFIFRTLCVHTFYLFVGICSALFVMTIFGKLSLHGILYSIPGFAILMLYFYGAAGSMAYLGLRYRDLQHAVTSIFSMLFIITPIVYPPEMLVNKGISIVLYGNPFASLIEVVRHPLLQYTMADPLHYWIAFGFSICIIMVRFFVVKKWERYIPFWS